MKKLMIAAALCAATTYGYCEQPGAQFENQWCQKNANIGQQIVALASKNASQDEIVGQISRESQMKNDFFASEVVRYIAWKRPGFENLKKGELESWFKAGSPQCREMYNAIVRRVQ